MRDLDDLQEEIGGLSMYQFWVLIGAASVVFGSAFSEQSGVIFSAVLPHRCSVPPIDDETIYPGLNETEILELTIPMEDDEEYSSCERYAYDLDTCTGGEDFSCITDPDEVGTMKCDKGWSYDNTYYEENTISEWDLVCDRRTLDSMANSLFFFGWFLGSFTFGPLSDWFGRKLSVIIYAIGLFVLTMITAFVPWFPFYVVLRILSGACTIAVFLATFTYISEMMTFSTRVGAALYLYNIGSLSHVIMPWTAYLFRDWRAVAILDALLLLPYFVIQFFLPKSPRWLFIMGRESEAREVLDACAKSNDEKISDELWAEVMETERKKLEKSGVAVKYTLIDLFRLPLMRIVSINVMYSWFVVSMVFYGLTLNGGNLAGNPYVNTTLNALAEIVGHMMYYWTRNFGRRRMLSISFGGGGLCCLLSMTFDLVADGNNGLITASVTMAIIGKLFASMAFNLVYSVASEAYPTAIRATGLSIGSMAARIGGMITPFTLQLQYSSDWLTQAIFGTLSLIAAATAFIFPETKDTEFITTLEEAEAFYTDNMPFITKLLGITPKRKEKGETNLTFEKEDLGKTEKHETKF